jgi:hypothetical protein
VIKGKIQIAYNSNKKSKNVNPNGDNVVNTDLTKYGQKKVHN